MKKFILILIPLCLSAPNAFSMGRFFHSKVLGVSRDFSHYQMETQKIAIGCKQGTFRKLTFWAGKHGRYSFPRLTVERIEIHYGDSSQSVIEGDQSLQHVRGFYLNVSPVRCIDSIVVTAQSTGSNSTAMDRGFPLEVWSE